MECATHVKCTAQEKAERLAHLLAEAIESGRQSAMTAALKEYERWV